MTILKQTAYDIFIRRYRKHSMASLPVDRNTTAKLRSGQGILALMLLVFAPVLLLSPACASQQEDGQPAAATTADTPEDRAARLAARSQLEIARTAQESYFSQHQTYADSMEKLREANSRLNSRIAVVYGNPEGYEISITANDAAQTVYFIHKSGSATDRRDSDGNSW